VDSPAVSVAYRNEKADLQAATRLACRVVPALVRIRRTSQFAAAALATFWVLYLVLTVGGDDGDDRGQPTVVLLLLGVLTLGMLLWSWSGFWAFHAARNALSRRSLGDAAFQADSAGITTSVPGSSGSHSWSHIDRVADGDQSVIFVIGKQMFVYVPARSLPPDDRATLHHLATSAGREWLDLRTGRAAAPG
jgi:hypothetical protein